MDLSKIELKGIENVKFLVLDGEAIIYSPHDSRGYYLNNTANLIWKCCDGKHSLEDIANKILESFTGEKHQIIRDIEEMLIQFHEAGLFKD